MICNHKNLTGFIPGEKITTFLLLSKKRGYFGVPHKPPCKKINKQKTFMMHTSQKS